MLQSTILIPEEVYDDICNHLIPKNVKSERVAFIFATVSKTEKSVQFQFKDWHPVQPHEYEYQSSIYVELKDEMRPKIIKRAFDLDAAMIEVHSHPHPSPASFSPSDLYGFEDFVPHVWWRLGGKPYAAIVFSHSDFDALVWIDNPKNPQQLTEIIVGDRHLNPNALSLRNGGRKYGFW